MDLRRFLVTQTGPTVHLSWTLATTVFAAETRIGLQRRPEETDVITIIRGSREE